MDQGSMDVLCFEDDNNHSSSSSGSLPQKPFSGYWSSFSSMDDNYVAGIRHEEVVDRVELGDTDLLNSSAVEIQEQLNELDMLMDSMDSTSQVSGDILQQCQKGNFHQSNLFHHPHLQIPNEQSQLPSNRSCSFDSSSSNYMMIDQPMLPASKAKHQLFSLATMEEMALTRAMLSVISSSSSSSSSSSPATTSHQKAQTYQSQANYCPPISSFQPYSSSKPPIKESHKNLHGQNMIKKAHNMLRSVNMLKDEGKMEETTPSAYQMQHMVSERRRRERLNASFHSLWQLLPSSSKKDKTSVLCKTVSYVKTLKDEIYDLEEKNRILEENLLRNTDVKEKSKPSERVEVQINKSSEKPTAEIQQIELVIMVRVQCDLIRVVLQVLECIKAMKAISLLSFDTIPNSQQMKLLATLKLTIEGSTWDERTFKEAITGAAHMALTMTA